MTDPLLRLVEIPGVAPACARAREAVDSLLRQRILRRRTGDVAAEAGLRTARATAALAGADWPLEDVRRAGDLAGQDGAAVVQSALRLSAELGTVTSVWERAPAQALARLHVLAATGLAEPDRLGRPRAAGEGVAPELDLPEPPPPDVVAARLSGLFQLLATTTRAPAIVVAAVVQGELLALRPFGVADGLVARAAARAVLVSRGLDPKALTAPDVGHLDQLSAYVGGARGYVDGDVGTWVVHCAEAVEQGAVEGLAVVTALER